MARQRFGRNTTVKLLGGTLYVNVPGRGTQHIRDRAMHIKARSENLKPLFSAYGEYLLGRIDKSFRYEGLPRRWQPLAQSTVKDRIRRGYGSGPILQRTGRLRRGFRKQVTPRTLQISNPVSARGVNLFAVHQQGTRTIPARPMLRITRVERAALSRLIEEHLS